MSYVVRPLGPWIGPITEPRIKSPFKAGWTDTLILLERELVALGAPQSRPWVMQIDVSERWIRRDGELYERAQPDTPAVRVAFESRHGPLVYATDRFTYWQDNIRAVALSLEALRKVDRYGVAGRGEQYRGWQAISNRPAEMTPEQAAEFLAHWAQDTARFTADRILSDRAVRDQALKRAARLTHPDLTGDPDTFARLTEARAILAASDARV